MKQSGAGIASMILGIVGLVFSCFILGIIPAFLGLIFAIVALCQKDVKKGTAIAGLVCSIIGILFSILIILFGIAGSSNANKEVASSTQAESYATSDSGRQKASSETTAEIISPGFSFDANDVTVTINDFDTNFTDYNDNYGIYAPQSGMKYVCVSVSFTNNSNSDRYVSYIDFQCYADDSVCEEQFGLLDDDIFGTSISTGRKTSGLLIYIVPENAQSIELEYETDFWTNHKMILKLK